MNLVKFWESKKTEIERFCYDNNISYEQLWGLNKSYSVNFMLFALPNRTNDVRGLYNDTYGKAVLLIENKDNKLVFTKTEDFKKLFK